jgi:uncharacterized protein YjbI with pentapeptide repeats
MNHPIDFCNQNLQNRSFPGLELNHANFSRADVRGCNFCHAQLQGANFLGAKFGQPPKVFISLRITGLIVLFATFTAISQMAFGVLGNTPETPAWSYTKALIASLLISGFGASLRRIFHQQSILEQLITTLSGTASAALLGFYYGGTIQNNNPEFAVISALITSIFAAVLCFIFTHGLVRVFVAVAGFISNYGLAFLSSSLAFAYLSTGNYLFGTVWSIITLLLLTLTMRSLNLAILEITTTGITRFRGANLDNAKFDSNLNRKKVDFTDAIAITDLSK